LSPKPAAPAPQPTKKEEPSPSDKQVDDSVFGRWFKKKE
jgi:hypothetical protein